MDTAALNASTLLAPEPGEDLLPEDAPGQKEDLLPEDAVLADFMGWAAEMEKARLAEVRNSFFINSPLHCVHPKSTIHKGAHTFGIIDDV